MSNGELCTLTLAEQARLIRERQVSPREVVASSLAQIEKVNPRLNAFITVMAEEATAGAEEAEREIASGGYRGPLHGIPIGLKDLLWTKGVRTTGGSKILADFVPEEDATVVTRLREAGAVFMGKLNMHEFAFGPTGTNPHYGDARNPWDPERITGGSSSGSGIAAATFMCAGTLGSDTGGSIRIPASLCGVVGIKPTYGRVSRYGAIPCAWSLDNVGPMCRTAEDAALVLSAIAGHDPRDPATSRKPVPDYAAGLNEPVSGHEGGGAAGVRHRPHGARRGGSLPGIPGGAAGAGHGGGGDIRSRGEHRHGSVLRHPLLGGGRLPRRANEDPAGGLRGGREAAAGAGADDLGHGLPEGPADPPAW